MSRGRWLLLAVIWLTSYAWLCSIDPEPAESWNPRVAATAEPGT